MPHAARLTASVSQYTIDEADGDLRFSITNLGTSGVTVTSAHLDWPGFDTPPVRVPYGRLAAGQSTGFTAVPGQPHCAKPPKTRPTIEATVDGEQQSIPLKVSVPGLLDELYRTACAAQRLAATASVELSVAHQQVIRSGSHYLPGTVTVRRLGGGHGVTVQSLLGSVLLSLGPLPGGPGLPARMSPGQSVVRVPVLLGSGSRCDPHSLSQSSVTFLLSAVVRLDGSASQRVTFSLGAAAKQRLLRLIHTNCS